MLSNAFNIVVYITSLMRESSWWKKDITPSLSCKNILCSIIQVYILSLVLIDEIDRDGCCIMHHRLFMTLKARSTYFFCVDLTIFFYRLLDLDMISYACDFFCMYIVYVNIHMIFIHIHIAYLHMHKHYILEI